MSINKHQTALRLAVISVVAGAGLHTANAAFDVRLYGSVFGAGDAIEGVQYTDLLEASVFPDDPAVTDLHVAAPFYFTDEFTSTETSGEFEWPQDGPENDPGGDSGSDNYGGAISGILYPPVSGSYTFHVRSDDGSALWLNPEGPEFLDLDAVDPIATESGCCGGYDLTGEAASEAFQLEVGQGYAFEFLWKEGGGGDWMQVGWSLNGGPVQTIPAYYVQRDVRYGDQNADGITGPGSADDGEVIAFEGRPTCCIGTEFDKEGVATIQWQVSDDGGDSWDDLVDDGNIQGAQSPAISFVNTLLAWDGNLYRAIVDGEESDETELVVDADSDSPELAVTPSTVGTVNGGAIRIEFDEPVDEATAMDPANYSFSDDKTVQGVTRDGLAYLIDVGAFDDTPFEMTVSGIVDLAEAENEFSETITFDFASGDFAVLIFTDMTPRIGGGSYDNLIANIERLQADARFPGSPDGVGGLVEDDFNVVNSATLLGGADLSDFGGFTYGSIRVEESGSYTFAIRADDPAAFYLSTDDSTANLPPVSEPTIYEPNCCGALGDNNSGNEVITLDLDAGDYAFEAYYFEFGGGDYMEIGWAPEGGTVEHIPASNLRQVINVGELSFAAQPEAVTVFELLPYEFSAVVEGSDKLGIGYQWFMNGEVIPGATGPSYSVAQANPGDDGAVIQVAAFNTNGTFSTVFSDEVVLNVEADITAPMIESITGTPVQNTVLINFDELIDPTTGADVANYSITKESDGSALAIESAAVNGDIVTIVTETQEDATRYLVSIDGVTDLAFNPNAADIDTSFNSFALRRGGLTALFYEASGANLQYFNDNYDDRPGNPPALFNDFGADPFANGDNVASRQSSIIQYFESPNSGDINTTQVNRADNYGQVIFGFVSPDVTGDYRFAIAVDDNSELWLSTDDDPENAELIATEPGWNGNREYDDGKQENISDPIPLVAGELYYIELIMSEGGGGDNAAVAWSVGLDGEDPPAIANGSLPINGQNLYSFMPVPDGIEIVTADPAADATGVRVDSGFTITLSDGIDGAVNPDTVVVTVGGEEVTSSVVSDNGSHVVSADPTAAPLAVNSSVELVVSFSTTDGGASSVSYTFTTEDIPSLNPAWATGLDSGVDRGFNVRVVQALDSAGRGNNTEAAEAQLADPAVPENLTDVTDVFEFVNFNQGIDDGSGGNGIFRGGSPTEAYQIADYDMAAEGLISSNTDDDDENHSNDWAMEVKTYVAFTEAGIYTMVVNSDDGFRVTAGRTTDIEESSLELGVFSGGRGASNDAAQSVFRFVVNEPGVYALRFIGYEGGGGSSMEWSVDNGDGTYSLLNDDSGLFAYASRTGDPDPVTDVEITSISVDGAGNVTVEYVGTLQTAPSVNGPYTDAAGASSPFTTTPGGDTMFFRVVQ